MGNGQKKKTTDTLVRVSCLYIQPIANSQSPIAYNQSPITNCQHPTSRLSCRQQTGVCDQGTAQAMQDYA